MKGLYLYGQEISVLVFFFKKEATDLEMEIGKVKVFEHH